MRFASLVPPLSPGARQSPRSMFPAQVRHSQLELVLMAQLLASTMTPATTTSTVSCVPLMERLLPSAMRVLTRAVLTQAARPREKRLITASYGRPTERSQHSTWDSTKLLSPPSTMEVQSQGYTASCVLPMEPLPLSTCADRLGRVPRASTRKKKLLEITMALALRTASCARSAARSRSSTPLGRSRLFLSALTTHGGLGGQHLYGPRPIIEKRCARALPSPAA